MKVMLQNLVLVLLLQLACWVHLTLVSGLKQTNKVAVIGVDTPIGLIVFNKIMKRKNMTPVGLVLDKRGLPLLATHEIDKSQLRICDITKKGSMQGILEGVNKVVVCTSAVPHKKLNYRITTFFKRLIGISNTPTPDDFYYKEGQRPYEVDYVGLKRIVDESVRAKVQHVVLLGRMGGYKGSKINSIGRKHDDSDLRNGNMLKWKRAAERYLMQRCLFTIIHTAKQVDQKELTHPREIIWDTDDALLRSNFRSISREDVAEVLVQALLWEQAIGRSIDISSKPITSSNSIALHTNPRSQYTPNPRSNLPSGNIAAGTANTASAGAGVAADTVTAAPNTKQSSNELTDRPTIQGDGIERNIHSSSSYSNSIISHTSSAAELLRFWSKPGNCMYPGDSEDLKFHS